MSKQKILVVDDDANLRNSVTRILMTEGFDTCTAQDGEAAKQVLESENIDLVISDVRMPRTHGIELFHYVSKNFPDLPFILMTGYTDIIEMAAAFELGVSDFIPKPFRRETLSQMVTRVFEKGKVTATTGVQKQEEEKEPEYMNFYSLPLNTFFNEKIESPIYFKLADDKIIKLVESGDDLTTASISFYESKGIEELYLIRDDFNHYVEEQLNNGGKTFEPEDVSRDEKSNLFVRLNEILEQFKYKDFINQNAFNKIIPDLNFLIGVFASNKSNYNVISGLITNNAREFSRHFVETALAIAIARNSQFASIKNTFILTQLCLFPNQEMNSPLIKENEDVVTSIERLIKLSSDIIDQYWSASNKDWSKIHSLINKQKDLYEDRFIRASETLTEIFQH